MRTTTLASATMALLTPALAIPPESFGFPSAPNDTMLTVTFPQGMNGQPLTVQEAALYGVNPPDSEPTIALNTAMYSSLASYNGQYIIMMVDPDASTPQNPSSRFIIHWLAPNMMQGPENNGMRTLTSNTTAKVPYAQPMPPPTSDPHRYIQYAFRQPSNFSIPTAFQRFNENTRSMFNLTQFISSTGLGSPAAANYFFCSNATDVPATFIGQPEGTFPGGNGGAVEMGPGSGAVATSAMMGGGMAMPTTSMPAAGANAAPTAGVGMAGLMGLAGVAALGLA